MIKSILIRIALLIGLCFGSFLFINKICFASGLNNVDGTTYPVITSASWAVELVKHDATQPYYTPKPMVCKVITDYTGNNGVQVRFTILQSEGSYKTTRANNTTPAIIDVTTIKSFKEPFKQPIMEVLNEGCSKYLDGDKCDNVNNKPIVYVSCNYVNQ